MFPGFFMPWPLLAGAFSICLHCDARSGRVWPLSLHEGICIQEAGKRAQVASCEAVFSILAKSFSSLKRCREKSVQIRSKNELKND